MNLLLGHLIGDFLLQPKRMAIAKGRDSRMCASHCVIYTICVWIFIGGPWWIPLAVGIPHFIVDRFSLAAVWMYLTGNRDFIAAYKNSGDIAMESKPSMETLGRFYDPHFTAIVYVVIDQTIHLACLWPVWFWLNN